MDNNRNKEVCNGGVACSLLNKPQPLSLCGQFLYPEHGQKQTFFDPLPPHLVLVASEWPLTKFLNQKDIYHERSWPCPFDQNQFLFHPKGYKYLFSKNRCKCDKPNY